MTLTSKKIIIIGGGASGLELATALGNKIGYKKQAKITLIDCNHSHLWKPLLHKVATGSLDEGIEEISYMAHAQNHYFQFLLGNMSNIDRKNKKVILDAINDDNGENLIPIRYLSYDILVIALGSISNDFNIVGVTKHCYLLDNQLQARSFRNKIINTFLKFSEQNKTEEKINIAIVGGGATGVELSAELHNTVHQLSSYGFKNINNKILNITLIEAGNRILPSLPIRISVAVYNKLIKLGIKILTKTTVTKTDKEGLYIKNGEYIKAKIIVWAAGIKAPNFMKNIAELETNNINQLIVKQTLQTTRDSNIFAIGDCSSCLMSTGVTVPPRAQAAHQMAKCVYKNIIALLYKKPLKLYNYKDYGSLVSLSKYSTIGSFLNNLTNGSIMIEGYIARIMYIILYRIHQVALYGYIKTGLIIITSGINQVIRPQYKLH